MKEKFSKEYVKRTMKILNTTTLLKTTWVVSILRYSKPFITEPENMKMSIHKTLQQMKNWET